MQERKFPAVMSGAFALLFILILNFRKIRLNIMLKFCQ